MNLKMLNSDELHLRAYYLVWPHGARRTVIYEIGYLAPSIVFAGFALMTKEWIPAWIAYAYLVGFYVVRVFGRRWSHACASLITKYEQRIAELEAKLGASSPSAACDAC